MVIKGVSVPHCKTTQDCATRPLLQPDEVTLVMAQHAGKPAVVCVEKGAAVCVGTKVGAADGFVSADIHSSVSGTVKAVTTVLTPTGLHAAAVVVESDGKFTPDPSIAPPSVHDAASLVEALSHSGIVGLGGAGFPTHVKLSVPQGAKVDTLIINGAECEPYITSDCRTMLEEADAVLDGALAVGKYLGLSRIVVAIEENKPDAIALLREKANGRCEVLCLKSSYPQGAEKVLIYNVTGRVVPAGKLPSDAGTLVLNVGTAAAIAHYLATGMPLVSRRVTVAGDAVTDPCNLLAPVGTSIKALVDAAGGYAGEVEVLLMGGPMMGTALYTDDFPLLKNNNAILALTKNSTDLPKNEPCIRCGRCVDTCPMRLSPAEVQTAYEQHDVEMMNELGALNCMECGCCTYVCPAKRSITQTMRLAKLAIRKAAKK
ncbi:MAG: electron transport complex subunit RsxC [Oscillospiraceae bacterium]|nr:electron transport complex subunit RsxC [Oscillospiraceae bacterium]